MVSNNERLKKLISRVLDIELNSITDTTSPETVESWDSFNGLMMVSELENEFSVRFTMDEVHAVKCVKDIKEALGLQGVKFEDE
ncbi:acyl carrier protein [bacterium]|nr:acyl carrier protein [bacterium]